LKKLLLSVVIFLTGCSLFVASPNVKVGNVNLVSFDGGGATLEFLLLISNPNSFDLQLLGYSYDLKIMTLPLAKGGARDVVVFPAGEEVNMHLPVRIAYGDLLEIMKRRPDPDNIPYRLQTGLEVETPLGLRIIPFAKKGTYSIPNEYRPAFYLQQIKEMLQSNGEK
jgi:LEA14-like dessication related protein